MKHNVAIFTFLSLTGAVLLSAGYLFPHCSGCVLTGFVPLLWMDRIATRDKSRHFFLWHYLTFLLWNLMTTFWICNATFWGGVSAMMVNSFLMSLVWALFRLFKRRFSGTLPYIFLAMTWIAWERFFFDAEISWPWLTLGNAFATATSCVQWYEVTGVLGGSLWIWACNLAVFGLSVIIGERKWHSMEPKARAAACIAAVLTFTVPVTASLIRYRTYGASNEGTLPTAVLQPDFDPYEKFEHLSQAEQTSILLDQTKNVESLYDSAAPLLLVAPETFTSDILLNNPNASPTLFSFRDNLASRPNTNILFGASTYRVYDQSEPPSYTARRYGNGRWIENYNSALMADGSHRLEIYHKSRLVVGVEKMPWPRLFRHIDDALGGVMGRCATQERTSLLNFVCHDSLAARGVPARIPLGCAVCYESVYPEHFASYVAAGAKAMTVITNDAWWGDTPGYRQHLSYARLRAIETRRDIARSANTGISAFIDSRGDIVSQTEWWTRDSLEGELRLHSSITPFVRHGDFTGRIATFLFLLLVFALGVNLITKGSDGAL